uniref:Uncharacterized protein n=1 Tax=Myoviridae sp. ctwwN25 TaxID=2825209 RepID=A0A8S5PR00_9CAUD|nr:MAG TPA: hypothetical protein [Myoviridae sp. ctwwN25]DAR38303.1 MAG TPA: hypothetical protein [Caudoviricetes sp.]
MIFYRGFIHFLRHNVSIPPMIYYSYVDEYVFMTLVGLILNTGTK